MGKLFTGQFAFGEGDSVVVIGPGRFGGAVAQSLISLGHDVMGTHVMVLRQLGVADFRRAIVGIGDNLAASLLTLMALSESGIPDIWVKALTEDHGKIAQRVGAHPVVFPEADMGERVAHLISSRMADYIEFDDGVAIAKIQAPPPTQGCALRGVAGAREVRSDGRRGEACERRLPTRQL